MYCRRRHRNGVTNDDNDWTTDRAASGTRAEVTELTYVALEVAVVPAPRRRATYAVTRAHDGNGGESIKLEGATVFFSSPSKVAPAVAAFCGK